MKTESTLWSMDQAVTELGISDESNADYHASAGLSFSGLKAFAKTPAHYIAYRSRENEETGAQRLGTLTHMAILERGRFDRDVVAVEGHRGGKEVKTQIASLEAEGKYVCKPDERESALRMSDAVFSHPAASKLLQGGAAEQSIRWRDEATGILMKCKPDYLRADGIIVDVKTYDDLSDENLMKQLHRMKYFWQSQYYLAGVNKTLGIENKMFVHLFIDTQTYLPRVVVLDDASLEKAEHEMRPLIDHYAECIKKNEWPGYSDEISTLSLPSWAW